MDAAESQLESLVALVHSCLGAYHPRVYGSPYKGTLHTAPPAAVLSEFLASEGARLPPSYKAFLALHNGWTGYVAGFTLVGVDGGHTTTARQDIKETLEIVADAWSGERAKQIAEFAAANRGQGLAEEGPNLGDMIPFGTDFNGALLLFDPRTTRPDGEMEVLLYDTSGPSKRHAGFVEMLRADGDDVCQ
jgi:hypothetical protein